jgi:hypothetical protein
MKRAKSKNGFWQLSKHLSKEFVNVQEILACKTRTSEASRPGFFKKFDTK